MAGSIFRHPFMQHGLHVFDLSLHGDTRKVYREVYTGRVYREVYIGGVYREVYIEGVYREVYTRRVYRRCI